MPFCIMTSDDTYQKTLDFLADNKYYGLKKEQIDVIKQENVPAFENNSGKIALKPDGKIWTKPHGHGDIHNLLFDSGVAAKWRDQGKEWMMFI